MAETCTLSARHVALTASIGDVQRFFSERIPKAEPIVNSLVIESNRSSRCATVTFKGSSAAACQEMIESLNHLTKRSLIDSSGTTSHLEFDGSFLGMTPLANHCADDEEPYFELVSPCSQKEC